MEKATTVLNVKKTVERWEELKRKNPNPIEAAASIPEHEALELLRSFFGGEIPEKGDRDVLLWRVLYVIEDVAQACPEIEEVNLKICQKIQGELSQRFDGLPTESDWEAIDSEDPRGKADFAARHLSTSALLKGEF